MKVGAVELTTGATSDTIRLQANVCYQDGSREQIWFEFPERLSPSVNLTADPWIVALAPISMLLGEPLETELTADSRLVCGLHRVARIWRYWFPALSPLQLVVASEERGGSPSGSTASLFSGGIDSWYTVLRNADDAAEGIPPALDSLLFIWGADVRLDRPDAFEALRGRLQEVAERLQLRLVSAATNLRLTRWRQTDWALHSHGAFFASVIHASGAFVRCLIPSSVSYSSGRAWGSHPLTDPLLSTSRTELVYDGAETDRIHKTARVIQSELALSTLRVCWRSGTDQNCGKCEKCLRTMVSLETAGVLQQATTFPARTVDLRLVRRLLVTKAHDYRRLRHMSAEALRVGRKDLSRALDHAYHRSARLQPVLQALTRLDQAGIRGATRLGSWLEGDSIRP